MQLSIVKRLRFSLESKFYMPVPEPIEEAAILQLFYYNAFLHLLFLEIIKLYSTSHKM